jgi:hypothetical protein
MATIQRQLFAIGGQFTADDHEGQEPNVLPMLLTYKSESPLAIQVRFLGDEEDILVDRHALFAGRYLPQELGSIRITPAIGTDAPENTTVLAVVEGRKARVALFQTDDISDFLTETTNLVPLGEEQMDVDSAIEMFFKEAGN